MDDTTHIPLRARLQSNTPKIIFQSLHNSARTRPACNPFHLQANACVMIAPSPELRILPTQLVLLLLPRCQTLYTFYLHLPLCFRIPALIFYFTFSPGFPSTCSSHYAVHITPSSRLLLASACPREHMHRTHFIIAVFWGSLEAAL